MINNILLNFLDIYGYHLLHNFAYFPSKRKSVKLSKKQSFIDFFRKHQSFNMLNLVWHKAKIMTLAVRSQHSHLAFITNHSNTRFSRENMVDNENLVDNFQLFHLIIGEATRVQILDVTDCISHSTNNLWKGMNPIILPPAMGK